MENGSSYLKNVFVISCRNKSSAALFKLEIVSIIVLKLKQRAKVGLLPGNREKY